MEHDYEKYQVLNNDPPEFRLVTIYAGVRPDYVVASLSTHPLNDHPPFEALSYVWGISDPEEIGLIKLNGFAFPVTTNLGRALYSLRSETENKIFWIDAICIDQDDLEERSSQVQLMRDIYKAASQTLVWLGDATLWSGRLFCLLKSIKGSRNWENENQRDVTLAENWRLRKEISSDKHIFTIVRRGLYEDIALRDFWSRIWIVQEVAISAKVIICCGTDKMEWGQFSDSIFRLNQASNLAIIDVYPDSGGLPNLETLSILKELLDHEVKLAIGDVLALLRRSRATDPRDMIYGILGLLPNCSIRPDYTHATTEDIYLKLVEYCITEERSLDIITLSRRFDSKLGLPSWVPNWTESWENVAESNDDMDDLDLPSSPLVLRYSTGELLRTFMDFDKPELRSSIVGPNPKVQAWSAHGSTPPAAVIQKHLSKLSARGIHVDVIVDIGGFTNRRERDGNLFLFKVMSSWESALPKHFGICKDDPNNKSTFDVFDRCLEILEGHLIRSHINFKEERDSKFQERKEERAQREKRYQQSQRKYMGMGSVVEVFVRTIFADLDEDYQRLTALKYERFWEVDVSESDDLALEVFAWEMATNRRLIITENGYIGLGPINAAKGDHVCILYGCSVPLILREVNEGSEVIGEAYVHGFMDGEAIVLEKLGDLSEKQWVLV